MPVREILQIGHPILAACASEVVVEKIATPTVQSWIDDLIDTMRDANGAGIAANQIGIPYRLFIIEVGDNPRYPYKPSVPLTIAFPSISVPPAMFTLYVNGPEPLTSPLALLKAL